MKIRDTLGRMPLWERLVLNKFRDMLDFLKEESLEFNPVHQLRNQGAA